MVEFFPGNEGKKNFEYIPATSVLSHTPSIRSVMKTAAVTRVAKKKTILLNEREEKREKIPNENFEHMSFR